MKISSDPKAREVLRQAVSEAGSQTAFARSVGLKQSGISAMISGKVRVSKRVATALGITLDPPTRRGVRALAPEQVAYARALRSAGAPLSDIARELGVTHVCISRHTAGFAAIDPRRNAVRVNAARHGVEVPVELIPAFVAERRASNGRLTAKEALNSVLVRMRRDAR